MMSYPMIGKKYYVKFPTMSFYLSMKDTRFIRQDAPLVEVDKIVF